MVKVKEDMTGWKMWEHGVPDSRITVLAQTEDYVSPNGNRYAQYLCRCNCEENNVFVAVGSNIKSGLVKTCGCNPYLRGTRKHNKYDLSGEYGVGWTANNNQEFYFDLEDYDKIKDHYWGSDVNGYIRTCIEQKIVYMHMFILGCKNIDHKNRNRSDNRKSNLRQCTHRQNMQNRSVRSDNKSGIVGVYFREKRNRWEAQIVIEGKTICLRMSVNKDDAIKARLEAEAKYYGEFAPQRHLFEQYKINVNGGDSDG